LHAQGVLRYDQGECREGEVRQRASPAITQPL
jgi:hypothetical protein